MVSCMPCHVVSVSLSAQEEYSFKARFRSSQEPMGAAHNACSLSADGEHVMSWQISSTLWQNH